MVSGSDQGIKQNDPTSPKDLNFWLKIQYNSIFIFQFLLCVWVKNPKSTCSIVGVLPTREAKAQGFLESGIQGPPGQHGEPLCSHPNKTITNHPPNASPNNNHSQGKNLKSDEW